MTEYSNFHLVMSNFIRSYVKMPKFTSNLTIFHSKTNKFGVKCTVERYFKHKTFGLGLKFHKNPWLYSFYVHKFYDHGH